MSAISIWKTWPSAVREGLERHGVTSLREFAAANQSLNPYDLAQRLAPQLPVILYFEAMKGEIRARPEDAEWLIRDSLSRSIREACPQGWRSGDQPEFDSVHALVAVTASLEGLGPRWSDALSAATKLLMKVEPGWKPLGPDDPHLVAALEAGLSGVRA